MKAEDILTQAMQEAFDVWRRDRHALSSSRRDSVTVSRSREAAGAYGKMVAYAHALALLWWGPEIERAFVVQGPDYAVSHVLWVFFGDKIDLDVQTAAWREESNRFYGWLTTRSK